MKNSSIKKKILLVILAVFAILFVFLPFIPMKNSSIKKKILLVILAVFAILFVFLPFAPTSFCASP